MPVTGNGPAELRRIIGQLEELGRGRWRAPMAKSLGAESVKLVKDCFNESRSPYGEKWKPLKYREGMPLLDTARLRNATQDASTPERVVVENRTKYAAIQNYGGRLKSKAIMSQTLSFNRKGGFAGRGQRTYSSVKVRPYTRGAIVIPARTFMPDERGLPASWGTALVDVAEKVVLAQLEALARKAA